MLRFLLIFSFLGATSVMAWCQEPPCAISRDARGRITTTCDIYPSTGLVPGMSSTHQQVTYLGSPYLTYPIWQKGVIQTSTIGKNLPCELAYDLVSNDVLCRFNGDPRVTRFTPYSFVISGLEFVRQSTNLPGTDRQLYATVVHNGPTKLLKSLSNRLIIYPASNGYEKEEEFSGVYQTTIKYYIRKENDRPQLIDLTKKSVVRVLQEQAKKIADKLPAGRLSIAEVVNALTLYDALMAATRVSKPIPEL